MDTLLSKWLGVNLAETFNSMNSTNHHQLPAQNVGILGVELYFPRNYISQNDLEKVIFLLVLQIYSQADNVSAGKYTKGLGQLEMCFCKDNEDVCSLALTSTAALMKNYNIDQNQIGYLEVGTETLVDRSKSVKSVLMDLFPENPYLEGADVKNACYGGTQALFHAVDWIYSNYEDEPIVVCVDIAIYEKGPARCTGGAGSVAFLVGPNAPLVLEKGLRSCYCIFLFVAQKIFLATNVYDFYKPKGDTEYPLVDGILSLNTYLTSADLCYKQYKLKCEKINGKMLFHSPFTRLTQKAFARLAFADYAENLKAETNLTDLDDVSTEKLLEPEFVKRSLKSSEKLMLNKLEPHLEFNRRIGNMYTPSLYGQLINAIYNNPNKSNDLNNKRFLLFSYGSGCISAMYSISFNLNSVDNQQNYQKIYSSASAAYQRMENRILHTIPEYLKALDARENLIKNPGKFIPSYSSQDELKMLFPNTFYLVSIDDECRRTYSKV